MDLKGVTKEPYSNKIQLKAMIVIQKHFTNSMNTIIHMTFDQVAQAKKQRNQKKKINRND